MRQGWSDCVVTDNLDAVSIGLPRKAWALFNHTKLTAEALGSLPYQAQPVALDLVGVHEMHRDLYAKLDALTKRKLRAQKFMDYMTVHFLLGQPERIGHTPGHRHQRIKVDYLRILRGWLFNPDGREAAVLKGWVASRFGLKPLYHNGPLDDYESDTYLQFLSMQSAGIYNTNALENQLDLLYHFCQYELSHQRTVAGDHQVLFRGVNAIDQHDILARGPNNEAIVLLNNLNSFTDDRERASEFGDYIMEVRVPLPKIIFYHNLLPNTFKGEGEVMVIGGLYRVRLVTF
ncbi:MAG: NAD(+)--dinitrogen-reductase ADP-D-ribosyltransferase [Magnetococcales bacterium]|nr:NAD(+)--dinitrogen-reductase ADP-D-ribosyltransferase [Magnetococcales bacterium]